MDCKLRAKNCGGCPMLATEYAAQLKKKEADVRALLGKYGPVAPIRGMETPYHYRNKVISTFAPAAGGKLTSGIYAARTHAVAQQYGFDLPRLLRAAWDTNAYYYENWQGLYVSGFTLAFQPAIFGNKWYGITLLCVLLPLLFCLYGLMRCVVLRLDPAQKHLPWALALLLTFAFIQGMPSPVEGLYWFNGAMNYLPYFSLAALNAGLAFALCFAGKLTPRQKVLYALTGCVCSLVIGGGHQVAGLLNVLVLLLAAVLCARRRNFWQLPAFFAAVLGLLLNVLAPGTRVRTAGFAGAGFAEAIVKSFILAIMQWLRWLDVPLLCLLGLLVLPLLQLARSAVLPDRVFRRPWLGAAVTFVLMWAMIFLPSYTMGGIGAGRLLNVVWMTFVLGLAATEFLLLGWLERVRGVSLHRAERFCQHHARRLPLAAACMLVVMACIGRQPHGQRGPRQLLCHQPGSRL